MNQKSIFSILMAFAFSLVSTASWSLTREISLDLDDAHIKGQNVILLKRALRDQYPGLDLEGQSLSQVLVMAKSRHGHGKAALRVANWRSSSQTIGGVPRDFRDPSTDTYYVHAFDNVSADSWGRWQLELQGNFKVRKVILVLDDGRAMDRVWWRPMAAKQHKHYKSKAHTRKERHDYRVANRSHRYSYRQSTSVGAW